MLVVVALLIALGTFVTFRFLTTAPAAVEGAAAQCAFSHRSACSPAPSTPWRGGGWGPVGTSSLLASGRLEPPRWIGSVDTAEFVVAVGGSLGFLVGLGAHGHRWAYVLALMAGGVVAAPIAALLVRHLPARVLGVAAGGLIVLTQPADMAARADDCAVTKGLLLPWCSELWVLWTAWAVKLDQPSDPTAARTATPLGA